MTERTIDETSSVGAAWPPVETTHNRMRGFFDGVVRTPSDADELASHFDNYQSEVAAHGMVDRLSIRTVASLGAIAELGARGVRLEGAMPIRGHDELMILYTAWNAPNRRASGEQLDTYRDLLTGIVAKPRDTHDKGQVLRDQGFTPKLMDRNTPESQKVSMVGSFSELYKNFGYDEGQVEELLLNPDNTIAYIEDDKGVVSTGLAERASIEIEGHGTIRMAEITEAFTRQKDRGNGYYKNISGYLVQSLLNDKNNPLDVIYGENNLTMPFGVAAAHRNGRNFSYFDQGRLGIEQPNFGILQQNFRVEDGTETRSYNDFVLSYIPLG